MLLGQLGLLGGINFGKHDLRLDVYEFLSGFDVFGLERLAMTAPRGIYKNGRILR